MRSLEDLLNLVPGYVAGKLTPEDANEFEQGLRKHPVLRREVEELRDFQVGLELADHLDEGHLDVEAMTQSVFSPDQIPPGENDRILAHTQVCRRCREAIELARSSRDLLAREETARLRKMDTSSLLMRLKTLFVPPRVVLSPAVAAITVLLLAIPAFYGVQTLWQGDRQVVIHQIKQLGTRAEGEIETVSLEADNRLLRLQILVPVQDSGVYDFLLLSSKGEAVFSIRGLTASEPMSVEIPTSYLRSEEYHLVFEERLSRDTIATVVTKVPIQVSRDD